MDQMSAPDYHHAQLRHLTTLVADALPPLRPEAGTSSPWLPADAWLEEWRLTTITLPELHSRITDCYAAQSPDHEVRGLQMAMAVRCLCYAVAYLWSLVESLTAAEWSWSAGHPRMGLSTVGYLLPVDRETPLDGLLVALQHYQSTGSRWDRDQALQHRSALPQDDASFHALAGGIIRGDLIDRYRCITFYYSLRWLSSAQEDGVLVLDLTRLSRSCDLEMMACHPTYLEDINRQYLVCTRPPWRADYYRPLPQATVDEHTRDYPAWYRSHRPWLEHLREHQLQMYQFHRAEWPEELREWVQHDPLVARLRAPVPRPRVAEAVPYPSGRVSQKQRRRAQRGRGRGQ